MNAEPDPIGHALVIVRLANAIEQALFGNLGRQLLTVVSGDEVEHQIERRGAPRAGQPAPIDLEQIGAHVDVGQLLHEPRQILPMDRAAMTVQEARPGQQVGTGAERSEQRA
jgi:hypothetical protein